MADRGMGRGLAAILPIAEPEATLQELPVDLIRPNPRQPRTSLQEDGIASLAESIREHGVLQPVLVQARPGGGYELIAGERRWRAARLADLDRIPALVRPRADGERLELALIENMAREDLSPVEAARACAALVEELGITKEEVARRVGRSRVAVSNLIRLLDLPDEALAMLEAGELTEGHGRALLQAGDPQRQRALARTARERGLSVRETEALARRAAADAPATGPRAAPVAPRADAEAARAEAEDLLSAVLGCEVRVSIKRRGCKAELHFDDLSDVRTFAERVGRA